jgi:hypothetical protein
MLFSAVGPGKTVAGGGIADVQRPFSRVFEEDEAMTFTSSPASKRRRAAHQR